MCSCRERTAAQDLAAHREGGQLHRPSLPPGAQLQLLNGCNLAAPMIYCFALFKVGLWRPFHWDSGLRKSICKKMHLDLTKGVANDDGQNDESWKSQIGPQLILSVSSKDRSSQNMTVSIESSATKTFSPDITMKKIMPTTRCFFARKIKHDSWNKAKANWQKLLSLSYGHHLKIHALIGQRVLFK